MRPHTSTGTIWSSQQHAASSSLFSKPDRQADPEAPVLHLFASSLAPCCLAYSPAKSAVHSCLQPAARACRLPSTKIAVTSVMRVLLGNPLPAELCTSAPQHRSLQRCSGGARHRQRCKHLPQAVAAGAPAWKVTVHSSLCIQSHCCLGSNLLGKAHKGMHLQPWTSWHSPRSTGYRGRCSCQGPSPCPTAPCCWLPSLQATPQWSTSWCAQPSASAAPAAAHLASMEACCSTLGAVHTAVHTSS